jgi:nicotinic acid mononucleotide adenylyltransferase
MRVAAYPGTFDPPTIAHLAVAEAAWRACGVERVVLVLSTDPIGKAEATPLVERLATL